MAFNGSGAIGGAAQGAAAGSMLGPWGTAGGALLGGLAGGFLGGGDDKARKQREAALKLLAGIDEQAGPSAFENEDPVARQSQLAALAQLEEMYRSGGMDAQSRAALQEAQTQTGAAERGSREALTQNAAARGMSGSGAAMAAQLANQQGAANRMSRAGTAVAGDARTRALQAMTQAGGAAGNVRGQDYQRSGALDSVERFNASQRLNKGLAQSNAMMGHASKLGEEAEGDRAQGAGFGGLATQALGAVGKSKGWW